MTKERAIQIAYDLTKAVEEGRLTEFQAKNQFRIIVYKYQQQDRFIKMQDEYPSVWSVTSKIME